MIPAGTNTAFTEIVCFYIVVPEITELTCSFYFVFIFILLSVVYYNSMFFIFRYLLLSAHVDGIIYVGMHDRHLDYLFDPLDKPLVFAYSHGNQQDSFVSYDNQTASADMTRFLISKGHRRIAVIAGHPHSYPTGKRMNGYQQVMQEAGLPIPEGFIRYGDWEYDSGYRETQELLKLVNRPTAIFAMNDLMAAGAVHALNDASLKVPADIAVAGFDNREIAQYLQPPLTTVALPTREIGISAAAQILEHIRNPHMPPSRNIILCTILERSSV